MMASYIGLSMIPVISGCVVASSICKNKSEINPLKNCSNYTCTLVMKSIRLSFAAFNGMS